MEELYQAALPRDPRPPFEPLDDSDVARAARPAERREGPGDEAGKGG